MREERRIGYHTCLGKAVKRQNAPKVGRCPALNFIYRELTHSLNNTAIFALSLPFCLRYSQGYTSGQDAKGVPSRLRGGERAELGQCP